MPTAETRDLWQHVHEAKSMATEAADAVESHEKICAIRYAHIQADLTDIKGILKWCGISIIGALAAVAWAYLRVSLKI